MVRLLRSSVVSPPITIRRLLASSAIAWGRGFGHTQQEEASTQRGGQCQSCIIRMSSSMSIHHGRSCTCIFTRTSTHALQTNASHNMKRVDCFTARRTMSPRATGMGASDCQSLVTGLYCSTSFRKLFGVHSPLGSQYPPTTTSVSVIQTCLSCPRLHTHIDNQRHHHYYQHRTRGGGGDKSTLDTFT